LLFAQPVKPVSWQLPSLQLSLCLGVGFFFGGVLGKGLCVFGAQACACQSSAVTYCAHFQTLSDTCLPFVTADTVLGHWGGVTHNTDINTKGTVGIYCHSMCQVTVRVKAESNLKH